MNKHLEGRLTLSIEQNNSGGEPKARDLPCHDLLSQVYSTSREVLALGQVSVLSDIEALDYFLCPRVFRITAQMVSLLSQRLFLKSWRDS